MNHLFFQAIYAYSSFSLSMHVYFPLNFWQSLFRDCFFFGEFIIKLFIYVYLFALLPCFAIGKPLASDIEKQYQVLKKNQSHIDARLDESRLLVDQILIELKKHSLPESLALLPMMESSYRSDAVSHANAAGLWQLMPQTAQRFGLEVSKHRDQRFDSVASTKAAIQYLSFLYKRFDGNLSLTLAAYNAGEGRVDKAIKKANSKVFYKIHLPSETRQYVSRFYALSQMVNLEPNVEKKEIMISLFSNHSINNKPLVDLSRKSMPIIQ